MGRMLVDNPWVKIGAIVLFMTLGLFFFLKKNKEQQSANLSRRGDFLKGLLISFLNPQAIPFWIFVLTYLDSSQIIHIDHTISLRLMVAFLLGVSAGKFLALLLYGGLSKVIARRSQYFAKWMNKIIGLILIGIGLFQMVQALKT